MTSRRAGSTPAPASRSASASANGAGCARSTGSRFAPGSTPTSSSSAAPAGLGARTVRIARRRPPAAHSRARRRRALLVAALVGRVAAGGERLSAGAGDQARRRRRPRPRRPLRPGHRPPPRRDRRGTERAACSTPASSASPARRSADAQMDRRRAQRLVRRREPDAGLVERARLAGQRADHLELRHAASTRSCASRGCTRGSISAPAGARRSSPRPTAWSAAPAGPGAMAARCASPTPAAIATSYSHMSRIVVAPGSSSARAS